MQSLANEGTDKEVEIYRHRFSASEQRTRETTWKVLCAEFFQNFISDTDTVIDLGAGDGLFIRNIRAQRRIAVDLAAHERLIDTPDVEVHIIAATELATKFTDSADVIFMSNFLEHLPDKRTVIEVLEQCRACLKPQGQLLVLQPNIRYVGPAYWDYIDHHVALTEHSLGEALELAGFELVRVIPRFLPYTVKSRLGRITDLINPGAVIRAYLRLPWLWRLFGGQSFFAARDTGNRETPDGREVTT
ncbi:MAG: class I SAM-dependent methyltransferase [Acidimicrobiales bacterium]|nr:class I SAM-dependent methyltransferase [Acidimicrobiales bacterium]